MVGPVNVPCSVSSQFSRDVAGDGVPAIECDASGGTAPVWRIPLPWRDDVRSRRSLEKWQVRSDVATRCLVAFPNGSLPGIERVHCVLHLGGAAEQPLHLRAVYLTVLFA